MKSLFLVAVAVLTLHIASSRTIKAAADEEIDGETARIVRGQLARSGQFPWMTALYRDGSFICTSSIISERLVMTAAHCVSSDNVTASFDRFHAIANVDRTAEEVRIDFEEVIPHPDYNESDVFANDIALFRTSAPIPFSDTVQPICIARNDTEMNEYRDAIAMGWGLISSFWPLPPNILRHGAQTVFSNELCSIATTGITDKKLCASGSPQRWLSTVCNGDSGGPLVHMSEDPEKRPVAIGVTSYGLILCGTPIPEVFTRVSKYHDFIKGNAAGESICEV